MRLSQCHLGSLFQLRASITRPSCHGQHKLTSTGHHSLVGTTPARTPVRPLVRHSSADRQIFSHQVVGLREKTSGRERQSKKSTLSLPLAALSQQVMWNLRGAKSKSIPGAAATSAHAVTGMLTCASASQGMSNRQLPKASLFSDSAKDQHYRRSAVGIFHLRTGRNTVPQPERAGAQQASFGSSARTQPRSLKRVQLAGLSSGILVARFLRCWTSV